MADLRIEWDETKAIANLRKHGVSFDEAETAFADDYALVRRILTTLPCVRSDSC